jgi:undecaprenyl diphosphate synthase
MPTCVGIILDGNRRWAKQRGLPTLEGHTEGLQNLSRAVRWFKARGTPHLVVYAFSTENWKREASEVDYLMKLGERAIREHFTELGKEGVRIKFIGDRSRLPESLQKSCAAIEETTGDHKEFTLWICLSYGARDEIIHAIQQGGVTDEASLRERMWSSGMPDPDIIIRTGGDRRLSNFLLFQAAYSELFFLPTLWPDFSEADLDAVLDEYAMRERRMGV